MEDISRELEREIARAKPTPHKARRNKRVLVIDDFGVLKSGTYLKVMVRILSVTTLVCGVAAASLYWMYNGQAGENRDLKARLTLLDKKATQLTHEKELLMAKLVMSGQESVLGAIEAGPPVKNSAKNVVKKTDSKAKPEIQAATAQKEPEPVEKELEVTETSTDNQGQSPENDGDVIRDAAAMSAAEPQTGETQDAMSGQGSDSQSNAIAVEKFSMSGSPENDELRVRFNIRNVKEGPGEISGRIFLVLKPEKGGENSWIVVPKAPLENGVPSVYTRGQYFSISRFKPVKFTISSQADPESFKTAAVYIFNDGGGIIFEDVMDIQQIKEE